MVIYLDTKINILKFKDQNRTDLKTLGFMV